MAVDQKVEHLKFIQAVVARMGTNSFLIKSWTVTLVAALFAFGAKDSDRVFIVIAWVPVLVFAGLDAYFLQHERMFRQLHKKVASQPESCPTDFSMDITEFRTAYTLRRAAASQTILLFYVPLAGLLLILTVYFVVAAKAPLPTIQGPKTVTISIQ